MQGVMFWGRVLSRHTLQAGGIFYRPRDRRRSRGETDHLLGRYKSDTSPAGRTEASSGSHAPHLPGAMIIHLTGMVGLASAWTFRNIRFNEGWSGYGSRIHRAEFKRIVRIAPRSSWNAG
jgi:hypothetical protein